MLAGRGIQIRKGKRLRCWFGHENVVGVGSKDTDCTFPLNGWLSRGTFVVKILTFFPVLGKKREENICTDGFNSLFRTFPLNSV